MTYTPGLKLKNYQTLVNTSAAYEVISSSIELYPDTEINYTPQAGSDYVIYEVCYGAYNDPDTSVSHQNTRLQESTDGGATWSDIDGCKIFESTDSASVDYDFFSLSHTFILTAWSGAKKLRLAGRSKDTSSEYTVNGTYHSSSYQAGITPFVSVYSV